MDSITVVFNYGEYSLKEGVDKNATEKDSKLPAPNETIEEETNMKSQSVDFNCQAEETASECISCIICSQTLSTFDNLLEHKYNHLKEIVDMLVCYWDNPHDIKCRKCLVELNNLPVIIKELKKMNEAVENFENDVSYSYECVDTIFERMKNHQNDVSTSSCKLYRKIFGIMPVLDDSYSKSKEPVIIILDDSDDPDCGGNETMKVVKQEEGVIDNQEMNNSIIANEENKVDKTNFVVKEIMNPIIKMDIEEILEISDDETDLPELATYMKFDCNEERSIEKPNRNISDNVSELGEEETYEPRPKRSCIQTRTFESGDYESETEACQPYEGGSSDTSYQPSDDTDSDYSVHEWKRSSRSRRTNSTRDSLNDSFTESTMTITNQDENLIMEPINDIITETTSTNMSPQDSNLVAGSVMVQDQSTTNENVSDAVVESIVTNVQSKHSNMETATNVTLQHGESAVESINESTAAVTNILMYVANTESKIDQNSSQNTTQQDEKDENSTKESATNVIRESANVLEPNTNSEVESVTESTAHPTNANTASEIVLSSACESIPGSEEAPGDVALNNNNDNNNDVVEANPAVERSILFKLLSRSCNSKTGDKNFWKKNNSLRNPEDNNVSEEKKIFDDTSKLIKRENKSGIVVNLVYYSSDSEAPDDDLVGKEANLQPQGNNRICEKSLCNSKIEDKHSSNVLAHSAIERSLVYKLLPGLSNSKNGDEHLRNKRINLPIIDLNEKMKKIDHVSRLIENEAGIISNVVYCSSDSEGVDDDRLSKRPNNLPTPEENLNFEKTHSPVESNLLLKSLIRPCNSKPGGKNLRRKRNNLQKPGAVIKRREKSKIIKNDSNLIKKGNEAGVVVNLVNCSSDSVAADDGRDGKKTYALPIAEKHLNSHPAVEAEKRLLYKALAGLSNSKTGVEHLKKRGNILRKPVSNVRETRKTINVSKLIEKENKTGMVVDLVYCSSDSEGEDNDRDAKKSNYVPTRQGNNLNCDKTRSGIQTNLLFESLTGLSNSKTGDEHQWEKRNNLTKSGNVVDRCKNKITSKLIKTGEDEHVVVNLVYSSSDSEAADDDQHGKKAHLSTSEENNLNHEKSTSSFNLRTQNRHLSNFLAQAEAGNSLLLKLLTGSRNSKSGFVHPLEARNNLKKPEEGVDRCENTKTIDETRIIQTGNKAGIVVNLVYCSSDSDAADDNHGEKKHTSSPEQNNLNSGMSQCSFNSKTEEEHLSNVLVHPADERSLLFQLLTGSCNSKNGDEGERRNSLPKPDKVKVSENNKSKLIKKGHQAGILENLGYRSSGTEVGDEQNGKRTNNSLPLEKNHYEKSKCYTCNCTVIKKKMRLHKKGIKHRHMIKQDIKNFFVWNTNIADDDYYKDDSNDDWLKIDLFKHHFYDINSVNDSDKIILDNENLSVENSTIHKFVKSYKCHTCGVSFYTEHLLHKHISSQMHKNVLLWSKKKILYISRRLSDHAFLSECSTKENVVDVQCRICWVSTPKCKVVRHFKMHVENSVCNVCNKYFLFTSDLNTHRKLTGHNIRSRDKRFKATYDCHICPVHFSQFTTFLYHLRSQHKIFGKCPVCVKELRHNWSMWRHLKEVHNMRYPFEINAAYRALK